MATNPMFINLVRGNRVTNYLGLYAERVKFGQDYTYVQLGLGSVLNGEGEAVDKISRNQHLRLVPDNEFRPHQHYKVIVMTNPVLQRVASVPAMYLVDGADVNSGLEIWATFRKDFDVAELDWLVRLYLVQ